MIVPQIIFKGFILPLISVDFIKIVKHSNLHLNLALNPAMKHIDTKSNYFNCISMIIVHFGVRCPNALVLHVVFDIGRHVKAIE